VLVAVAERRMVVWGKIGAADVATTPETVVRWGDANPAGSGWEVDSGGTIFVRANEVYVKTAAAPVQTPPPATTSSVLITVSDEAAYRDGAIDTDERFPVQGAWSTYPHPYSGAWSYGTQIAAACAGRSVNSMYIDLSRLSGQGGVYGGARMRLYLHDATALGNRPPTLYSPWSPGTLEPGEVKRDIALPSSYVTALASGSARGVGCSAGVGSEYLHYGDCGDILIKFN
jgi:hypothetical protein